MLMLLILISISPVLASVKLEYLGPYPLNPQPFATMTLRASAIVGNAGDEVANCTFGLTANQLFMKHFAYSFWINNASVRSFLLEGGQRETFFINLNFDPSTPVMDYDATIMISAVPSSTQNIAGIESFSIPVSIAASSISNSSISTTTTPEFAFEPFLLYSITGMALIMLRTKGSLFFVRSTRRFRLRGVINNRCARKDTVIMNRLKEY